MKEIIIQLLIENKEAIITGAVGLTLWIIREAIAPAVRHFVQRMPTKWHLDEKTGELVLKGVDKLLEKRFGRTAMLMNAYTDPGEATEKLVRLAADHIQKKFTGTKK